MDIARIFDQASAIMTLVSFITFIGIVRWAYGGAQKNAFAQAAALPFADDEEARHG